MSRRAPASDDGQMMVLIIGYILLALLLATVVMAASSVYLEHKKLLSLADGASVAAADSFTLGQLGSSAGTPTAVLDGEGSAAPPSTTWSATVPSRGSAISPSRPEREPRTVPPPS